MMHVYVTKDIDLGDVEFLAKEGFIIERMAGRYMMKVEIGDSFSFSVAGREKVEELLRLMKLYIPFVLPKLRK